MKVYRACLFVSELRAPLFLVSPFSSLPQLPVSTFWISERARWLPNTVPSLSLRSSIRLSSARTHPSFQAPVPPSTTIPLLSFTFLSLSSARLSHGTVADETIFSVAQGCQAFPRLNFPSLTAVCLLRRLWEIKAVDTVSFLIVPVQRVPPRPYCSLNRTHQPLLFLSTTEENHLGSSEAKTNLPQF